MPRTTTAPNHLCRHCGRSGSRPRRLCAVCYLDRGIRERFDRCEGGYPRSGVVEIGHGLPPPTSIPPGEAKVAVLEWRAEHGFLLFNPQDATVGE